MVLKPEPFVRYKTDEEKSREKGTAVTVWMNSDELEQLEAFMKRLGVGRSAAIKLLYEYGKNLLEQNFPGRILDKWIRILRRVPDKKPKWTEKI